MSSLSIPSWVPYLLAINAAIAWLAAYVSTMYPHVSWILFGIQGSISAAAIYLGWAPSSSTTS